MLGRGWNLSIWDSLGSQGTPFEQSLVSPGALHLSESASAQFSPSPASMFLGCTVLRVFVLSCFQQDAAAAALTFLCENT